MKQKTLDRLGPVSWTMALLGLLGLAIAFFIDAAPILVIRFGGLVHWLFTHASTTQQIAIVSAFVLVGGISGGIAASIVVAEVEK